jgi:hypothetical protein
LDVVLVWQAGQLAVAADVFAEIQELVVLKSSWGGRSRLQRALCLDSLARTDEAKELYQQIRNHPEVRMGVLAVPHFCRPSPRNEDTRNLSLDQHHSPDAWAMLLSVSGGGGEAGQANDVWYFVDGLPQNAHDIL